MLLMLDDMPFTTAIKIIKYCQARGIDRERSQRYYDKLHRKPVDLDSNEWVLEVPDHLVTFFRIQYGGLE